MTPPRFLVIARPPIAVRKALEGVLDAAGLAAQLNGALFDPVNWHQSLCDRCYDRSSLEFMRRACARVRAPACALALNRIRGRGTPGAMQWAFHARGTPACFTRLLTAVNDAFVAEGLPRSGGHTPHITISYRAPCALPTYPIRPILWHIDEFFLVEGHSVEGRRKGYVYEVIDRWSLLPPEPDRQRDLFDETPEA